MRVYLRYHQLSSHNEAGIKGVMCSSELRAARLATTMGCIKTGSRLTGQHRLVMTGTHEHHVCVHIPVVACVVIME